MGVVHVQPGAVAQHHVHQQRAGLVLAVGLQFLPAVGEGYCLGVEDGGLVGELFQVGRLRSRVQPRASCSGSSSV